MSSAVVLSLNDKAVLGALFDPEASLDRGIAPTTRALPDTHDSISEHYRDIERNALQLLNTTDNDDHVIRLAIKELTSVIDANPNYAAAYVNRAQARRLLPGSLDESSSISQIMLDVTKAISLATPRSATDTVTADSARTLSSAHTHRGYLLMRASTSAEFRKILLDLRIPFLKGIADAADFEELASRDFTAAGRYGNKTAQQLAVKTNPYAKLCGQIVKEALQREIKEYYEGVGVV